MRKEEYDEYVLFQNLSVNFYSVFVFFSVMVLQQRIYELELGKELPQEVALILKITPSFGSHVACD